MILTTDLKINTTEAKKITNSKASLSSVEIASKSSRFSNISDIAVKVVRPWQKKLL